jgi:predicted DNA-binding transcriptional regulator YafY
VAKSDRLLLILNLLRSRRNLKASDLAKECDVSERTIYRDINAISSANIPIYFDKGYRLLTDAFLRPLNFTFDELVSLYLGVNSNPVQSLDCLRMPAKRALAKIESLIPERIKADYERAKELITNQLEKQGPRQTKSLIFDLIRQAIFLQKQIKLHYVSARSSYEIELTPKTLLYKKGNWYLAGLIQKKTKHFRLDMIKSVSLL